MPTKKPVAKTAPAKPARAHAIKTPKTIGTTIDLLFEIDQELDAANKVVKEITERRAAIEDYLRTQFAEQDVDGAHGKLARVEIKPSTYPECTGENWTQVWAYVAKRKAFDLIQKRLNVTACRERWDSGEEIPGVEQKVVKKLTIKPL